MADHNMPFSTGVIKGVLSDMVVCIKELILDGKNVKLDNLAIFSVGIVSKGAASVAAFTVANNVKGLKLRARATGELSNSRIKLEGELKEAVQYSVSGTSTGSGSTGGTSTGCTSSGDDSGSSSDGGQDINPLS